MSYDTKKKVMIFFMVILILFAIFNLFMRIPMIIYYLSIDEGYGLIITFINIFVIFSSIIFAGLLVNLYNNLEEPTDEPHFN